MTPKYLCFSLLLTAFLCCAAQAQAEKESKSARDYYRLGLSKADDDKYAEAIANYDRAIQLKPDFVDAYINRGIAKKLKGDFDGAVADYTRAMELDPETAAENYNHIGIAKRAKGDYDGAIAAFDQSIKLSPASPFTYYNRGLAKKFKLDLDGALADFTSAIKREPEFSKAYYNRALIKTMKGAFAEAIPDYSKDIKDLWDDSKAWFFRRFLRQRLGLKDDLEQAVLRWNPGWDKEMAVFLTGGMSRDKLFKKASEGDADTMRDHQCRAFFCAGMVALQKGDRAQARALLEKCLGTSEKKFDEYLLAETELARMKKS